jgi:hypothetical protein
MDPRHAEDEFISQNSYRLNDKFYCSLGEKQAFVVKDLAFAIINFVRWYAPF